MNEVRLTVHRATSQIGGNCIELATSGHRILLDVGRPLDAPNDATGLLPATLDLKAAMGGVIISHPHQDHYGLLEETPRDWPVICGEPTKRLMQLTSGIFGKPINQPNDGPEFFCCVGGPIERRGENLAKYGYGF